MRISDLSSDVCSSDLVRCRRGIDVILLHRAADLGGLAIGMARVQRGDIGVGDGRVLCELRLQPVDQRLAVAVEHPKRQAQRPHVLAAQRFLVAKAEGLHRVQRKRSEEHTSELQSLMRISYAVFCLKKKKKQKS